METADDQLVVGEVVVEDRGHLDDNPQSRLLQLGVLVRHLKEDLQDLPDDQVFLVVVAFVKGEVRRLSTKVLNIVKRQHIKVMSVKSDFRVGIL